MNGLNQQNTDNDHADSDTIQQQDSYAVTDDKEIMESQKNVPSESITEKIENKSIGSIIAIIIIASIIILGGLYLWGGIIDNTQEHIVDVPAEDILSGADKKTDAFMQQGNSDEINDIDVDLSSTDFNGIDAEINNIDTEFNF